MDIPRTGVARPRMIRRIVLVGGFALLASGGTYTLTSLRPAAPAVERIALWTDKVKRGSMLRDVHGTGFLVPENFAWIPSTRDGVVERINATVGETLLPHTIIAELANPEL